MGLTAIMEEIAELFMATAQHPNYAAVLALDRKLHSLHSEFVQDEEGLTSRDAHAGHISPLPLHDPRLIDRPVGNWHRLLPQEASRIADASIAVVYEPSSDCVRAKEERAHSSLASFASNPSHSPEGDVGPAQSTGDIPGLPTGIAIRSGESATRNARRAARWYSQHGRGARFQALRHAQGQMFGTQSQYFGHTSPHMLHPVNEIAQLDATGHYFDAEVGPGSGEFAAVTLPVGPPEPMAMPYSQPINTSTYDNLQWSASLSDSSYGSTPENLTQQELQASWSDFLSTL
ncbi:960_t:CDS:2 [Acaulospora colombiana]|uniref:960_t:CDS:1 n=1 Tax=Acaulospora colombiana TaxID=27376 RepID=A0ACA9NVD0_9GLOM|nr:960_t:CDS:2 [Acaulospora colombiana]